MVLLVPINGDPQVAYTEREEMICLLDLLSLHFIYSVKSQQWHIHFSSNFSFAVCCLKWSCVCSVYQELLYKAGQFLMNSALPSPVILARCPLITQRMTGPRMQFFQKHQQQNKQTNPRQKLALFVKCLLSVSWFGFLSTLQTRTWGSFTESSQEVQMRAAWEAEMVGGRNTGKK